MCRCYIIKHKFKIKDEKPPAFKPFARLSPRRINDLNMVIVKVIRAFNMKLNFFSVMSLSELYIFRQFTEICCSINFTLEISI